MGEKKRSKTFSSVVLIADVIDSKDKKKSSRRRDLEKSELITVKKVLKTIGEIGIKSKHYQSPDILAKNASIHANDLVLSIYGGEVSRNRMALVPAICETFGLKFIGPDVYGRIIAQDKEVSKRLARDAGLETPDWLLIRSNGELASIKKLSLPCVVKPLMEGSSIGISQSSLCRTSEAVYKTANSILTDLKQPVLIESFVPGRETALSVIETPSGYQWAYSEVAIPNDPNFFDDKLFDAQEKAHPTRGRTVKNIDNELDPVDLDRIITFLKSYGVFGYCRVDGRHYNGKFHFLEITPDAWIDPKGQFAMAFIDKGMTYHEVIEAVLFSTSANLPNQSTNGLGREDAIL